MDSHLYSEETNLLGGVEDLEMMSNKQIDHLADLKPNRAVPDCVFNLDLEENWNEILPHYSENNFLSEALEELESADNIRFFNNTDLSPAPTHLSAIPSTSDDDFSDFVDIEGFLNWNRCEYPDGPTENSQCPVKTEPCDNKSECLDEDQLLDSLFNDNTVKDTHNAFRNITKNCDLASDASSTVTLDGPIENSECPVKTEPYDIKSECLDEEELFGSYFSDNTVKDIHNAFPNITKNCDLASDANSTITLESVVSYNKTNDLHQPPDLLSTNNYLRELMIKSGIQNEPTDTTVAINKRKSSEDVASIPGKSPRMAENDPDDVSSAYSSCVSSPEDNRIVKRRMQNNEASKISRANRKSKHQQLFEREKHLQEENKKLRKMAEEMSREAEVLRQILIDKLSGKN